MSICIYMGGAKCAESHCDLWDLEEKRCLYAIIIEKEIELLDIAIKEATMKKASNNKTVKMHKIKEYLH